MLRAIGWQESRLQPAALGRNANGSIDVGAFQINSIHLSELARYGIDRAALADGCVSAPTSPPGTTGARSTYTATRWQAVGDYHSRTPARAAWYANQIAAILMRWKAMPPGALPFPVEPRRHRRRWQAPRPTVAAPLAPSPRSAARAAARRARRARPSPRRRLRRGAFTDELAYLPPAR